MQHFQAIALFAFLSIITPGPNNLMIMTSSMNFGVRKSLPHYCGLSTDAAGHGSGFECGV